MAAAVAVMVVAVTAAVAVVIAAATDPSHTPTNSPFGGFFVPIGCVIRIFRAAALVLPQSTRSHQSGAHA
jgi:hypothetical protein